MMSVTHQTTTSGEQEPAPSPEGFAQVHSALDVGPQLSLPGLRLLLAAWLGAAGVAALGTAILAIVGMTQPRELASPWVAWLGLAIAKASGLLWMRPWKPRYLGRWPFVWLGARGVSFGAVLILSVLLYFAARPEPLPFGLVIAGGYFAALLCEVAVYSSHIRSSADRSSD